MIAIALMSAGWSATVRVEPAFVVQEKGWAPVVIEGITLPPHRPGEEGHCSVVLQVDPDGRLTATPTRCDTVFADRTVAATLDWEVSAGTKDFHEQEVGVTLHYVFDEAVRLQFDERWVRSPVEDRPKMIDTSRLSIAKTAVPRYPEPLLGSGVAARCTIGLTVARSGRPKNLEPVDCPEAFQKSALSAIKKWRWDPPLLNGQKVDRETRVTVNFKAS